MFGIENYLGFILAAILLNLTPGTDSMYIITRSVSQGQTAGVYSVLGITSGILVHTLLAALGLSVLLANSPTAFMIVKYIGASYLCYLGLKMLLSKNSSSIANNLFKDQNVTSQKAVDGWQIYKQGVLTNTFNPKVALFFLAFFPQFIDANYAYGMLSFLMLGLTFATTGFIWCLCLAMLASKFSKKLRENPKIESMMNKISGVVFMGLGIKLLTEKT
ncbi:LysE family translocator [Psychrobacter sp. APC 3279]|uniref:LysE family translocator n=1 Tax=unclassified Psychrobacter TaxID=196806 RepID=UPI00191A4EEC|nr:MULTISPECIES: LysE family translocator [unclassified Psychrobacter]MDN3442456.1 LysE family translocator [Psychrobacter sp. APC 3279]